MQTTLGTQEIVIRLILTVFAGAFIGINRGEHGSAAGLRTTILVCLAASVSMIQVNLLLAMGGRHPDSFVMLDLMRLPLGILSGMGFIGAGAILRRQNMVIGVTTAATLWFVTVMGLCFGGGQIWLGMVMLALGSFVLWFLKWAERWIRQDRHARLCVMSADEGPDEEEIRRKLAAAGYQVISCCVTIESAKHLRSLRCDLQWRGRLVDSLTPTVVLQLAKQPGVLKLEWRP